MPMPMPMPTTVVPRRIRLTGRLGPERAAELVDGDRSPVVLTGRWADVSAVVASEPLVESDAGAVAGAEFGRLPELDGGGDDEVRVGGGWFGLISYRAAAALVDPGLTHPPERGSLPRLALGFYDHVLVREQDGSWYFEMLWSTGRAEALEARAERLARRLERATSSPAKGLDADATGPWRAEPTPAGHARAVAACRERIAAGDLYQANIALRLSADLHARPAALFAAGVAALAPERAAFVAGDWGAVASLSPELLARRSGRAVVTEPIKGTRPRDRHDAGADEAARAELAGSAKDRSENVMIVDLMRNDLGRVCSPGSVVAEPVCEVRPMAGVWHMVSEVRADLRQDSGDRDLAAALLPAGSVTGAPKHAALSVIAELESAEREAFCGSVALCSPLAGLELSVVIRTFECAGGRVWLDVGGAVTAASDPQAEAQECMVKAEPLLHAIGASLDLDNRPPSGDVRPLRTGGRPLPRPDPAAGVFTTMLVTRGRAERLDDHLERLSGSVRGLYGIRLPDRLRREVRELARGIEQPQRLRITISPDGDTNFESTDLVEIEQVVLAPVCVPGGLGAHKWGDRRLVDALSGAVSPHEPLLVDLDGSVLEASRWAIVADIDGLLVTPRKDGRILPSIGIRELHGALSPRQDRLTIDDLRRARQIYVTNAVRGMTPALLAPGA